MLYLLFLLFLFFNQVYSISNGYEAGNTQFPYAVAILNDVTGHINYVGTLISNQYVLTWDAVFPIDNSTKIITMLFGAHNILDDEPWRIEVNTTVENVIFPENPAQNDIVLIKLPEPIEFSEYIQPVQLPSWAEVNNTFENLNTTIIGYGVTNTGSNNVLFYGNSSTLSNVECIEEVNYPIYQNQICESSANSVQICVGDFGSPMLLEEENGKITIIGIASAIFSLKCGSQKPVIYTRVSTYLDFIANNSNAVIRKS